MNDTIYDFTAQTSTGETYSFDSGRGKVFLIVNTASKCGFTPQYEGLEKLYREYGSRGLEVIAFPCDQFAHQEPGDDEKIRQFCSLTYGVTFPVMAKTHVNGKETHPLYAWLKKKAPGMLGGSIKWNFTKFLVSGDGREVTRYAPKTEPKELRSALEKALS